MRYRLLAAAAALAVGVCAQGVSALTFNFSPSFTTTADDYNAILPKFQMAADRWSSLFSDNITINLSVGYVTLSPGVIGSTTVSRTDMIYQGFTNLLTSDAKTPTDATALANLPTGVSFGVLTRDQPNTNVFVPASTLTTRNSVLSVTTANSKALGSSTPMSTFDGTVVFSKAYTFDYDPSDGIDPGLVDFVGVATHEIGHVLGFSSGVDTIDRNTGNGPLASTPTNLAVMPTYSPLDMFRHSAAVGVGAVDGVPGDDAFFSIDGGTTAIAQFSRGFYNGNNAQASHWLDNLGLGIMDPTASKGELLSITDNDRLLFDTIGYDLVPEPSSLALLLAPAGASLFARRRRHTADGAS
jgi:hypothetical protein